MCSNFHWCLGQENKNLDILVKASNFLKQAAFQKALLAGVGCLPLPCLHVVGGFGSTSVTVTLYVWCHWWPCCSHDLSISATVHCVCVCVCAYLLSHVWFFCDPHGLKPTRFFCPWDCPGKNTGVGCRFLLQGTFLTQEWNPCLLHLLHWQTDSLPLRHLETPHKSSKEKGLL